LGSTGRMTWEEINQVGDRIYNLIRAYWKRENPDFGRKWDYPPDRWFEEPHSTGKMEGVTIDRKKYEQMLSWYYELRGWDENGIPRKETLSRFGLKEAAKELWK
jgi:aldehyde:ferredoxin oxidoreductase